jgi:transposase
MYTTGFMRRNVVERGFCQLEHWCGLATRSKSTPAATPARRTSPLYGRSSHDQPPNSSCHLYP